jgi:hypothetical protein
VANYSLNFLFDRDLKIYCHSSKHRGSRSRSVRRDDRKKHLQVRSGNRSGSPTTLVVNSFGPCVAIVKSDRSVCLKSPNISTKTSKDLQMIPSSFKVLLAVGHRYPLVLVEISRVYRSKQRSIYIFLLLCQEQNNPFSANNP